MSEEILKTKEMKYPINLTSRLLEWVFEQEPTPPDLSGLRGYRLRSAYVKWYLSLTDEERGAIERNREVQKQMALGVGELYLKLFGGEQ